MKHCVEKNPSIDVITFCKIYGEQLPLLKEIARTYLSIPRTSVPMESVFRPVLVEKNETSSVRKIYVIELFFKE